MWVPSGQTSEEDLLNNVEFLLQSSEIVHVREKTHSIMFHLTRFASFLFDSLFNVLENAPQGFIQSPAHQGRF
jgi:hypothetical protein